jgi:hypothetical protein
MSRPQFLIASSTTTLRAGARTADFLRDRRLLKTLSLLEARAADVPIPPTLLLLEPRPGTLRAFAAAHGGAVMMRMDYSTLSAPKPLGGIALFTDFSRERASAYLFAQNLFPLFHPNLDRFQDQYSAGLLLNTRSAGCRAEIVGPGFDASDLRLGASIPHESLSVDLARASVLTRSIISESGYEQQRSVRILTAKRFRAYTKFVNRTGRLLSSLDRLTGSSQSAAQPHIPPSYCPMPDITLSKLLDIGTRIRLQVLDRLPRSEEFVASLSFVPKRGWLLWDIYGAWYHR